MVSFMPSVCISIRKSCQRRDCLELGNIRNWVDHLSWQFFLFSHLASHLKNILFINIHEEYLPDIRKRIKKHKENIWGD